MHTSNSRLLLMTPLSQLPTHRRSAQKGPGFLSGEHAWVQLIPLEAHDVVKVGGLLGH